MPLADDLLAVLNDPTHMWSHALKGLSGDAQRLFLGLTILPKPISTDTLQIAHTIPDIQRSESFLDSLRSLEDSFVKIERPYGSLRVVEFRNPSLQDFAYMHLNENTDYLDILLRRPAFYEQVVGAFTLALTHEGWIYRKTDKQSRPSKRRGESRYPGIKNWVDYRSDQLIATAVDLLDSVQPEVYRYVDRSRLSQLIDIADSYGLPSSVLGNEKLQDIVLDALNPWYGDDARVSVRMLSNRKHRSMLDAITGDDSASIMRENILDKDTWKFGILSKLDQILDIESQETWESWGKAYTDYARDLVQRLADRSDTNVEDIRQAILEVTPVSNTLAVDMSEELEALNTQRASLASLQQIDHNESSESSDEEEHDYEDASFELGQIFSNLL